MSLSAAPLKLSFIKRKRQKNSWWYQKNAQPPKVFVVSFSLFSGSKLSLMTTIHLSDVARSWPTHKNSPINQKNYGRLDGGGSGGREDERKKSEAVQTISVFTTSSDLLLCRCLKCLENVAQTLVSLLPPPPPRPNH